MSNLACETPLPRGAMPRRGACQHSRARLCILDLVPRRRWLEHEASFSREKCKGKEEDVKETEDQCLYVFVIKIKYSLPSLSLSESLSL